MPVDAYTNDGQLLDAARFTAEQWEALKTQSANTPDMFRMSCCNSRAVLKTSLYGVQFFAHYSDECANAPETLWHIAGKDMVVGALAAHGIKGVLEASGGKGARKWEADVLFEVKGRRVAIELQRSYQHLRDFIRRQDRYNADSVECYWLLRGEVATPLMKSIVQKRLREEFGGKLPPGSFFPALPTLPWLWLKPEESLPVLGPGIAMTVERWMGAVLAGTFRYSKDKGAWLIHD
jgi:competence protein CoiA